LLLLVASVRGIPSPGASLPLLVAWSIQEVFMKKLVAFVFLLALAVGYAACGGGNSSPTAPNPQPGTQMTPTPTGGY
jgi:hypothetical protein